MHKQIRMVPARSPADLKACLEVLAAAEINITAAGGSNLEQGGEFAFMVTDDQEERAIELLRAAGYQPRVLNVLEETEEGSLVETCWMTDQPGELLRCVTEVTDRNQTAGRAIKDVSIGPPHPDRGIPVQIYSEVFRGWRP